MANEKSDKTIDDGGHAFPTPFGSELADGVWCGMSVRMWLAGQNMAAFLVGPKQGPAEGQSREAYFAGLAKVALTYADALILESKK